MSVLIKGAVIAIAGNYITVQVQGKPIVLYDTHNLKIGQNVLIFMNGYVPTVVSRV